MSDSVFLEALFQELRKVTPKLSTGVRERILLERAYWLSVGQGHEAFRQTVRLIVAKNDEEKDACDQAYAFVAARCGLKHHLDKQDSARTGQQEELPQRPAPSVVAGNPKSALKQPSLSIAQYVVPALILGLVLVFSATYFFFSSQPEDQPSPPPVQQNDSQLSVTEPLPLSTIEPLTPQKQPKEKSEKPKTRTPIPLYRYLILGLGSLSLLISIYLLFSLPAKRRFKGRSSYRLMVPTSLLPGSYFSAEFLNDTAEELSRSQERGLFLRLDSEATARATAESGGIPKLIYRPKRIAAPILILLEENKQLAPWLPMILEWITSMKKRGVRLEYWRLITSESLAPNEPYRAVSENGLRLSLDELHAHFPEHRLLVIASDDRVWDWRSQASGWVEKLTHWSERSWLRPSGRVGWHSGWQDLSRRIPVFAFDEEGLRALGAGFRQAKSVSFAIGAMEEALLQPLDSLLLPGDYDLLCGAAVAEEIDLDWIRYLRQELFPQASMAVFSVIPFLPDVQPVVTGLYRLPPELRRHLLEDLKKSNPLLLLKARLLRGALLEKDTPLPAGSLADLRRQYQLTALRAEGGMISRQEGKVEYRKYEGTPVAFEAASLLRIPRLRAERGLRRKTGLGFLLSGVIFCCMFFLSGMQSQPESLPEPTPAPVEASQPLDAIKETVVGKYMSVIQDGVSIRSGPGTGNEVIWEVFRNFPMEVLDLQNEWAQVKDFEGDIGWIQLSMLSDKKMVIVREKTVNLRKGPSEKDEVVAIVKYGVVLDVWAVSSGWLKVRHEDGTVGWMNQDSLWPDIAEGEIAPGIEMVSVKGGCFQMGCGDWAGECQDDEKPVHEVCVDDFSIGKYEVTQVQWQMVMGENPSGFKECGVDCPVENVSWEDVQEFVKQLNNQTSRQYRLPTEAEWEYAARSGGNKEKYAGGDNIHAVAWYDGNSDEKTHSGGGKQSNGFGIYDMSGNVFEWCNDWFGKDYYAKSPVNNPQGPLIGLDRVSRGGGWINSARGARAALRYRFSPGLRTYYVGFRLVLLPGQQEQGRRPGQESSGLPAEDPGGVTGMVTN